MQLIGALDDEHVRRRHRARQTLPNLDVSFSCLSDLVLSVWDCPGTPALYPLQGHLIVGIRLGYADAGKTLHTIQAVARGKHLHVQLSCRPEDQSPHVGHHRVMQAGVDLVNQQKAASRLGDGYGHGEHSPDSIAHAADWNRHVMTPSLDDESAPR